MMRCGAPAGPAPEGGEGRRVLTNPKKASVIRPLAFLALLVLKYKICYLRRSSYRRVPVKITTPETAVLKLLWDLTNGQEGRPIRIARRELVRTIQNVQGAGVPVYRSQNLAGVETALVGDIRLLEVFGFVKTYSNQVWLTGAGELAARDLEFSDEAKSKLATAGIASARPT